MQKALHTKGFCCMKMNNLHIKRWMSGVIAVLEHLDLLELLPEIK